MTTNNRREQESTAAVENVENVLHTEVVAPARNRWQLDAEDVSEALRHYADLLETDGFDALE